MDGGRWKLYLYIKRSTSARSCISNAGEGTVGNGGNEKQLRHHRKMLVQLNNKVLVFEHLRPGGVFFPPPSGHWHP